MEFVALVLAVLGIFFIFIGWKMGKDDSSNEELLAILKGVANLKKEVSRMEDMITSLEDKIEKQETAKQAPLIFDQLLNSEFTMAKLNTLQTPNGIESKNSIENLDHKEDRGKKDRAEELLHTIQQMNENNRLEDIQADQTKLDKTEHDETEPVSQTFSEVLKLYNEGLNIQEISRKLGISQDAVNMVILTSVKGGKQ